MKQFKCFCPTHACTTPPLVVGALAAEAVAVVGMASTAAAVDGGSIHIRWQEEINNDEGGSGRQQQQSGMIIDINGGGSNVEKATL